MTWILSLGMFICNHVFMYVYICSDKLKCVIILFFFIVVIAFFLSAFSINFAYTYLLLYTAPLWIKYKHHINSEQPLSKNILFLSFTSVPKIKKKIIHYKI